MEQIEAPAKNQTHRRKRINAKDAIGERFGRLVIVGISGKGKHGASMMITRCDCGESCTQAFGSLRAGDSKSCGCLQRELARSRLSTHGASKTKEYKSWLKMKERCCNPNEIGFSRYGGRGIRVCERWMNDFECFLRDMGNAPTEGHTIERKDTNGDYDPSNCIWATRKQQNRNRRDTVLSIPLAARIRALKADGVGRKQISRVLDLPQGAVDGVFYGRSWS